MNNNAKSSPSKSDVYTRSRKYFDASGTDRHWTRQNLLLPFNWRNLSPGDIAELSAALLAPLGTDATVEEQETRRAIAAVLTTGRRLSELHKIRVYESECAINKTPKKVGIYVDDGAMFWKLPPGKAVWKDKKKKKVKHDAHETNAGLSPGAQSRLSKRSSKRPKKRSLRRWVTTQLSPSLIEQIPVNLLEGSPEGVPLFTISLGRLETLVGKFMRRRRGEGSDEPRWASRTLQSLERYLTMSLIHQAGGDPCLAARITNRTTGINRAALSYGFQWTSQSRGKKETQKAIGSPFYKDTPILQAFVSALQSEVENARERAERYEALSQYSVEMIVFGLGHRGTFDHLPSTSAIDETTQFCVLNDKDHCDPAKARLVWVADEIREQIRRYEHALCDVLPMLSENARETVLKRLGEGKLSFLDLRAGGSILTLRDVMKRSRAMRGNFQDIPINVGRHWLRSHLAGRCSTESLHAFFGHSNSGTGPWVHGSCFDPLMYRADLRRTLPALLKALDWHPVAEKAPANDEMNIGNRVSVLVSDIETKASRATARSPFFRVVLGHASAMPEGLRELRHATHWSSQQDDIWQLGQLMASAIANGALLDREFWDPWLRGLASAAPWDGRSWITMETEHAASKRTITRRWFSDPVTAKLIKGHHEKKQLFGMAQHARALTAEMTLQNFLNVRCRGVTVDEFYEWAKWRWRLRLPPLLFDHAMGEAPNVTMDERSWCQLVGKRTGKRWRFRKINSDYGDSKRAQAAWIARFEQDYPYFANVFNYAYRLKSTGTIGDTMEKRFCAETIFDQPWISQGHRALSMYCHHRLTQERPAGYLQGFAPSTIRYRLATILAVIFPGVAQWSGFRITEWSLLLATRRAVARCRDSKTKSNIWRASRDLRDFLRMNIVGDRNAGAPESILESIGEVDSDETQFPDAVSANILSEEKYVAVLRSFKATQEGRELQMITMLGFRTGMRLPEILGLRLDDFVQAGSEFEVHITHTRQRRLKTHSSRRILPLSALLNSAEKDALVDWLTFRRSLPCAAGISPRAFGPPYSRARVLPYPYENAVKAAFKSVGISGANFAHLRHSFASNLLLNLLMPDQESGDGLFRVLRSNVSWERSLALKDVFLGEERIGQASLHAVSQALGHTGVARTTESYQHLLDVALDFYTSRPAVFDNASCSARDFGVTPAEPAGGPATSRVLVDEAPAPYLRPTPFDAALTSQPMVRSDPWLAAPPSQRKKEYARRKGVQAAAEKRNDKSTSEERALFIELRKPVSLLRPEKPDWSVIWSLIVSSEDEAATLRAATGIDLSVVSSWKNNVDCIVPRFIHTKGGHRELTIPAGGIPQALQNKLWKSDWQKALTPEARLALAHYLGNYEWKNGFGKVSDIHEAFALRKFLRSCGIRYADILINHVLDYHSVPSKKIGQEAKSSSRKSPGCGGRPTVSLFAGQAYELDFGRTVEITRRKRVKAAIAKARIREAERSAETGETSNSEAPEPIYGRGSKNPEPVPVHRHAIYATKFFLLMVAVYSEIAPLKLDRAKGWKKRPKPKAEGEKSAAELEKLRYLDQPKMRFRPYRGQPAANDD